jgi:hypothetical protein
LGLYDPLETEELNYYLECLEFLDRKTNLGIDIPRLDYEECHYTPIARAMECVKTYFEAKLSTEEYFAFKFHIDSLKTGDPKKINKAGIIEIDRLLVELIEKDKVEKSR